VKPTILLSLFCLCTFSAFSQNYCSIKGSVTDTVEKAKLSGATVSVLNAKDSILRAFVWTDKNGAFTINNLPKGQFILLVTYPGYADYGDVFTLDSLNKLHDFGDISMILKSRLLAEVIIKGKINAIKINGDTTEFNAKAYVIQPNDKVESLLKQLPGIQVDKDGHITAQGQKVNKVLVDGEEFFGDDPTLVTRNLRADMVDKVQLYDKKSDQAAFAGVDDGKTTKTINIKLKEDKNNGEFGTLDGNIATAGYYEGELQFNKFKPNEKFALFGTVANDGNTGFNYQDNNNDNIQNVDGGITIIGNGTNALDSYSGNYNGKGIPVVKSAGAHYDGKWNNDKESINANYKIGAIDVTGATTTAIQQTLPTGIIKTFGNQTFNDYAFHQKLDATYQVKLDTTSALKIMADGTDQNFHLNHNYVTETDTGKTLLNRSNRSIINQGTEKILNASAFYTKKFKKVGRTLSWSLSESYDESKTDGYLNSTLSYYNGLAAIDSSVAINQYKTTDIISSVLNSNITYSEPITGRISMLVNYGFAANNSTSDNKSFDASAPGVYEVLDGLYSNDYKFNQVTNQVGAILNYKYKKAIVNFGTKISDVAFKQTDGFTGDVLKRYFVNWLPQAMFQYKFSQQKAFIFNYYGNTTQPAINQIQPVLVNTDPLNITIGNPNLIPSFTNRFSVAYNSYQIVSGQQLFINGSFSNTYDAIVNNTSTSATGANTTQYVNLKSQTPYNYSLYASLGRKISPVDLGANLTFTTSGSVSYSYINGALDMSKSHTYSAGLSLGKYVDKKYDFTVSAGPSYTFSSMSLQPQSNNNAAGFNASGFVNLHLPLNFGLGSGMRYTYTAQTRAFAAEYLGNWYAYVFKTFLKDDKLKISLSGNNLLNENTNFNRGITGNTTTQTISTGIRRFFMLSVNWDFTKFSTVKPQN
jgi:hypothetical protein